jgi:hypothetical protein
VIGRRASAFAGAGLVASLLLAGCSTPAPGGGTDGSNGQPGQTQPTTPAPPGNTGVTEGALPPGFPADFPLIEGDVLIGLDLGTGWSVWIASADPASGYAEAVALLTADGYAELSAITNENGSFGVYSKGAQQVQLSADDDQTYGPSVSYTIFSTE